MAVRIRMKKLGRKHRPFFRVCAMDKRAPRDGKVIEELGYYDPMCREKDARAILKGDRIAYWMSVGAVPSRKCAVLIKKYGQEGTHLDAQATALEKMKIGRVAPAPVAVPLPKKEEPKQEEAAAEETPAAEATADGDATASE